MIQAAYLFHIVCNQPFIDGNKRTGAMAAYVFLQINDVELQAPENEFTEIVLAVARGEIKKDQIADSASSSSNNPLDSRLAEIL